MTLESKVKVTQNLSMACNANLTEGIHIKHNDCLWFVDDNDGFKSRL